MTRCTADPSPPACAAPRRAAGAALTTAIVAATLAAHFPAVLAGYLWDDSQSLYENPLVKAPDGLRRIWLTTEAEDYWPLTSTMFWLEWRLWGDRPMPYHVGNILLHAIAAVLLWRVLRRLNLGEPAAWLGGLLLAVHPVTVASVAWIAERKNLLSMVFALLAVLAWLRFDAAGRRGWYALALAAAAAALLAKTSVVMLPVVLLVLVWYQHGRISRRHAIRTIPFFTLSLVLGLATVWFQHHNVVGQDIVRPEGVASRVAASGWIAWFYFYKVLFPVRLAMIYPRWDVDGGRLLSFVPLLALGAALVILWTGRRRWGRGPLAAVASFVLVLAPVLGFIDMSYMRNSLVADHLQYPALPALLALAAALLAGRCAKDTRPRTAVRAARWTLCGAVVAALAVLTWRQAATCRDEETLWTHAIRLYPANWAAYNNRGAVYSGRGDADLAIRDLTEAIRLRPGYAAAYNNRGAAYYLRGDADPALRDYSRAIELNQNDAAAWNNRGVLHHEAGDHERAIRDFDRAVALKRTYARAYNNRGNARLALAHHEAAIRDYSEAIRLDPDYATAYNNRASARLSHGDPRGAIEDCTRALALRPDLAPAYNNRAMARFGLGQLDLARADVRACRRAGGEPSPELVRALVQATGQSE